MLLKDGVKYDLWIPRSENEFEQVVKEHSSDIFSEQSIYLDIKTRLKSELGAGSIPDGFVIFFGEVPQWHIVEVELSDHPLHDHIVAQIGRFISGIENPSTQKKIVNVVYSEIVQNDFDILKLRKAIRHVDPHKFISDLISKQPILTIIIEKETPSLKEGLKILNYPHINVVEFQTFTRLGVGLEVHAHLFEPLYKPIIPAETLTYVSEIPNESIEIKFWPSYREYDYIGIWRQYRDFFPDYDAIIELITDDGAIIKTKVVDSQGSTQLWDLGTSLTSWYSRNPHMKAGDRIRITAIEPMKKYRLEILK